MDRKGDTDVKYAEVVSEDDGMTATGPLWGGSDAGLELPFMIF